MPYIREASRRWALDNATDGPQDVGELTYVLYRYCLILYEAGAELSEGARSRLISYIVQYLAAKRLSYQTLAEISGALTNTRHEFQRRIIAPALTEADAAQLWARVDPIVHELLHVQDHVYGLLIAPYEDLKILENGDVEVGGGTLDELHVAALAIAGEQNDYPGRSDNAQVEAVDWDPYAGRPRAQP